MAENHMFSLTKVSLVKFLSASTECLPYKILFSEDKELVKVMMPSFRDFKWGY